jgi:hypothetical protein
MSTRNNILVIDRKHSSRFPEGFAIHPEVVADKAYVNMYMHHDGYPEWQGVQIANWLLAGNNGCQDGQRLASKLVHDMYYDSCYLQRAGHFQSDIEYIYIIWTGDRDKIHVSCWNVRNESCEFVLKPEKIISKYMEDYDYTDFANGKTRCGDQKWSKEDIAEYNRIRSHAQRIVDILTNDEKAQTDIRNEKW